MSSKRLRVGDLVQVITGKEKGKTGRVSKLLWDTERVIIEGVNQVTRHQKPNQKNQQGGKITKEASLHMSNVMPVDPTTNKPTRVKAGTTASAGAASASTGEGKKPKKTRVAKSGAEITTAS
jgi:large subunit ribosomal protein L24